MLRSVAVLVLEKLAIFEFGVVCEVFGIDRGSDGVPNFDFRVCGPQAGRPLQTSVGAQVTSERGLDGLVGADLVAVPAVHPRRGRSLILRRRSRRFGQRRGPARRS